MPTTNPLTVKILGSGNAAKKHAQAFAELPELYQITDSDTADVIDICTPNHLHFMAAANALTDGKHAIVEKPLAGSLESCDTLISYESEVRNGARVFPISQYRFADHELVDVMIYTCWRRDAAYHEGWRGDWKTAIGGCLTTHGVHAIDLAIRKHGMPKIVTAGMDTHLGPERFANVIMGRPGYMIRVATFIHPDIEQNGFRLGDSHTGYVNQFTDIHDAITRDAPPPVTLAEARDTLEVLTAAYWSAYTGEPAMLPIGPEHPFYRGWSQHFAQRSQNNQACLRTRE